MAEPLPVSQSIELSREGLKVWASAASEHFHSNLATWGIQQAFMMAWEDNHPLEHCSVRKMHPKFQGTFGAKHFHMIGLL